MFRSATLRVTLITMVITMAISFLFSAIIYHFSAGAIQDTAQRQYLRLRRQYAIEGPFSPEVLEQEQTEAVRQLWLKLVYLNVLILGVSGLVGFYLARQTLEPIEQAMELQSQFSADASHELRTPLAAMRSQIEVTLRQAKIKESESRELLTSNLEEIAKLEGLASGLLQLSRLEARSSKPQPVAVNELIKVVQEKLAVSLGQEKITFKHTGPKLTVLAEPESLQQLLVILIDNAIKYAGKGAAITVTTKSSGHRALITVADNGPGIKPEDRPHVFERFWRASTSRGKDQAEGYGLGLAIAKEIAILNHGEISLASAPGGQGAAFTVNLPMA